MSGYGYDYSLASARPADWRSTVTGFVAIVAVVAVSTVSGAIVTLELVGSPAPRNSNSRVATVTPVIIQPLITQPLITQKPALQVSQVAEGAKGALSAVAPRAAESASAAAATAHASPQPTVAMSTGSVRAGSPEAPQPPVTATAAPAAAAPATTVAAAATVPDSELTFAKGYAQRRAAHERQARTAGVTDSKSVTLADNAGTATQFGRPAIKLKPRVQTVAAQDPRQDPRRQDGFWSNHFDFERHQALAYGDSSRQRRAPSFPFGGMFDHLF
jgi:hypothetical protein